MGVSQMGLLEVCVCGRCDACQCPSGGRPPLQLKPESVCAAIAVAESQGGKREIPSGGLKKKAKR